MRHIVPISGKDSNQPMKILYEARHRAFIRNRATGDIGTSQPFTYAMHAILNDADVRITYWL